MGHAIQNYTVLSINGEKWSAYMTDAKRDARRWYFQCHGKSALPGIVGFYSPTLDAGAIRIHEGK